MARQWMKFEDDVKKLIKKITSFKSSDDNFGLCLQFAQSNLLYHQFLTVNSHTINRALDGVTEKFAVHSDEVKSIAFKKWTEKFLDSEDFEFHDKGRTDTHYALLSLLLNLANNPTQAQYEEWREEKDEGREEFDWKAYLMEGEDIDCGPFPESPEWSSEEEEDEDYKPAAARPLGRSHGQVQTLWATDPRRLAVRGLINTDQNDIHDSQHAWLNRNIMVQYWEGEGRVDLGWTRDTTLSSDWENHLASSNPLYTPAQRQTLTEYQVLREVLWMMSGNQATFVFDWDGVSYRVRSGLQVAHLTQEALYNFLEETTKFGNITSKLSDFIANVTSKLCRYDDTGNADNSTCQTYHAFAAVLSKVLQQFKDNVLQIQTKVGCQDTPATLMKTVEQLSPWLPHLQLLDKVYEDGVVAVRHQSNAIRAQHLLSVLYGSLLEMDTLGQDVSRVALLLRVWAHSSRPYWDIIDRWIFLGSLSDPYREFLVQRNETVSTEDENFWDTAFTLHLPKSADTSTKLDKTRGHSCSTEQPETPQNLGQETPVVEIPDGHVIIDLDQSKVATSPWEPGFLQPILQQVILAGKSMEMLQALGRLGNIIEDRKEGERKTMYETFIETLQEHLTQTQETEVSVEQVEGGESGSRSPKGHKQLFMTQIDQQMHVKGIYDPLLRQNFANIFDAVSFTAVSLTKKEDLLDQQLSGLSLDRFLPIRELLEVCLYGHVTARYEKVCSHLLDILKDNYHLQDHFSAMKYFHLLGAGATMYDFYTEIFDKLRLHEPWQDVSFLNTSLQEALSTHCSSYADRIFVSVDSGDDEGVEKTRPRDRQPISALDDLRLHYKVPWPVSVIIHPRSVKIYNAVFTFFLQVKRSKYMLDRLRFKDLEYQSDKSSSSQKGAQRANRIHRMQLFRMKLMLFINSLHDHIMTRILHSTELEFAQDLQEAVDLDEVIKLHSIYVAKLHKRCLLHHSVRYFKYAVTKVMALALVFTVCWEEGVDDVSEKQLGGMESEFGNYIQFLTTCLNNVIKRGTHPHLESLVYTLLSSNKHGKPLP